MMLPHIRQTMHEMTTSENRKGDKVATNKVSNSSIRSLRCMAGNEPDREQTGT